MIFSVDASVVARIRIGYGVSRSRKPRSSWRL
jgi:hypothetical protein